MVSRRKILSRSRDDLNLQGTEPDEEDVWYQKDKLFKVECHRIAELCHTRFVTPMLLSIPMHFNYWP